MTGSVRVGNAFPYGNRFIGSRRMICTCVESKKHVKTYFERQVEHDRCKPYGAPRPPTLMAKTTALAVLAVMELDAYDELP